MPVKDVHSQALRLWAPSSCPTLLAKGKSHTAAHMLRADILPTPPSGFSLLGSFDSPKHVLGLSGSSLWLCPASRLTRANVVEWKTWLCSQPELCVTLRWRNDSGVNDLSQKCNHHFNNRSRTSLLGWRQLSPWTAVTTSWRSQMSRGQF